LLTILIHLAVIWRIIEKFNLMRGKWNMTSASEYYWLVHKIWLCQHNELINPPFSTLWQRTLYFNIIPWSDISLIIIYLRKLSQAKSTQGIELLFFYIWLISASWGPNLSWEVISVNLNTPYGEKILLFHNKLFNILHTLYYYICYILKCSHPQQVHVLTVNIKRYT